MRFHVLTLLAALTPLPAVAAAPCLTPAEAEDLILYVLPEFIEPLSARCATVGEPVAWPKETPERYRSAASEAAPRLTVIMERLQGHAIASGDLAHEVRQMLDSDAYDDIAKFTADDCRGATSIIEAMAPMPPRNMARMFTSMMATMSAEELEGTGFSLCKTGRKP